MDGNEPLNGNRIINLGSSTPTVESRQAEDVPSENPTAPQKMVEPASFRWLTAEEIAGLQSRWNTIQAEFVDKPGSSVEHADALIEEIYNKINRVFSDQRKVLNDRWSHAENVTTEDLRIALQGYRGFLNRLLSL